MNATARTSGAKTPAKADGGRLLLRMTTRCNNRCAHCTIADIAQRPDKSVEQAAQDILDGQAQGFRELVVLRGEATLLKPLHKLVRHARAAGFGHVQIQTNGRMLAYDKYLRLLLDSGVTFFEVSLYGHTAALHDRVAAVSGAFDQTVAGLRGLVKAGCAFMVTVPVLKRNYLRLDDLAAFAADLGVRHLQFNFPRPVRVGEQWQVAPLVRLADAAPWVRAALQQSRRRGLTTSTEGLPLCHLGAEDSGKTGSVVDFTRFEVHELQRTPARLANIRQAAMAIPCRTCGAATHCSTTWPAYLELFGAAEFVPFEKA